MAKLAEGNKYGLSSNIANFGDKTVVHLKLTDTASKAIDEYLKHKVCQPEKGIEISQNNLSYGDLVQFADFAFLFYSCLFIAL